MQRSRWQRIDPEKSEKTSLTFVQRLHCGATATIAPLEAGIAPAPSTPPNRADEDTVRKLTLAYLAAKDRGDFDTAHAMLAKTVAAMLSADTWREPCGLQCRCGKRAQKRTVVRVTRYDDPAGSPHRAVTPPRLWRYLFERILLLRIYSVVIAARRQLSGHPGRRRAVAGRGDTHAHAAGVVRGAAATAMP